MTGSSDRLGAALDAAGLPRLADRARADEFHDFRSPHAMPQHALIDELAKHPSPRVRELADRVIGGEFDATREESDEWARSPDGQATFAQLTDPRSLGGEISGPGGPFDHGETVLDATRAVLVDEQEICKIDPEHGARGQDMFALLFEGRINQSQDRAKVMLLGDLDLLAALVTQIHGVAERAGPQFTRQLRELCDERWAGMPHP